jgi:hypothetical protein
MNVVVNVEEVKLDFIQPGVAVDEGQLIEWLHICLGKFM